jgi:hypothetical protein
MDALLTARATTLVTEGYIVKLDADTHVVLAKPVPINHILHGILTVVSFIMIFPFWGLIWLLMILRQKEELYQLDVVNGKAEGRNIGVKPKQNI